MHIQNNSKVQRSKEAFEFQNPNFFAGSSAYDSVRSLSYAEADVFLVCYKISDPSTLYNVKNKWMPEIRKHRSDAPVILCGCQSDLRRDPEIIAGLSKRGRAPVSSEQALAICCDVGASNYVETSACTNEDIMEAFEVGALACMKNYKYNTTHSHHSEQKFNTSSSKDSNPHHFNTSSSKGSNPLNISIETSEFSAGQVAQPQEAEDFFPHSPPLQPRRSMIQQRASFSVRSESYSSQNNLSRRASFRSPPLPVQVNSKPGSPNDHEPVTSKVKAKAYESLKSQGSTGSTGSSSKTSTGSSALMDLEEPNTEDPDLLNQLNFVSPKAGVFRPVNPTPLKIKDKDKCVLMWNNKLSIFKKILLFFWVWILFTF